MLNSMVSYVSLSPLKYVEPFCSRLGCRALNERSEDKNTDDLHGEIARFVPGSRTRRLSVPRLSFWNVVVAIIP